MGHLLYNFNFKLEVMKYLHEEVILTFKDRSIFIISRLKAVGDVRDVFVNFISEGENLVFGCVLGRRNKAVIENGFDIILLHKSIFHLAVHFCVITLKEPDKEVHKVFGG